MPRWYSALALALCAFVSIEAHAGRRPYTFTWDTEILKKGEVELEEWLWGKSAGATASSGWLWFAPVFGLSERVELAFPWEIISNKTQTSIADFAAEARIRLGDPHDDLAFYHALVRLFVQQNFNNPANQGRFGIPWAGADFVSSFGNPAGSHATLDLGIYSDFRFKTSNPLTIHNLGAGYAHSFSKEFRLSAEYFHEIGLSRAYESVKRYSAGPVFAFSRGNVWANFGILFGLSDATPDSLIRFMFAVAI